MVVLGLVLAACVGVVLGLLGGGGSILTVPLLHYVLGVEAHAAVAISFIIVATMAIAALVPYARRGQVQWRLGVQFGIASMCGSYGAARVAQLVPPPVLLFAFALVLSAASLSMLIPRRADIVRTLPMGLAIALGVAVGAVAGFVGAGGGFLIVPVLVAVGNVALSEAVGTSLFVIAVNSLAGFAGAGTHATVALEGWLIALLAAVSVAGSLAGASVAGRLPAHRLRVAFGVLLAVLAITVLVLEGPAALSAL